MKEGALPLSARSVTDQLFGGVMEVGKKQFLRLDVLANRDLQRLPEGRSTHRLTNSSPLQSSFYPG